MHGTNVKIAERGLFRGKGPEFVTKQWFWFEVRHSHVTHKWQCQQ